MLLKPVRRPPGVPARARPIAEGGGKGKGARGSALPRVRRGVDFAASIWQIPETKAGQDRGEDRMATELPSLDSIGLKYRTDKATGHHGYLSFYERFFQPRRQEALRILEVGVLSGASLSVWEEYFPRAQIVGADISPAARMFERARVAIEIIDQSSLEDLARLAARHGPFDIIVEDGSHMWEHQITTLRALFPFVRAGGLYIVEDLQTNYGALAEQYRGTAGVSCMEYLKRLADLRVADDQLDIAAEDDAFLRSYGRGIAFIAFHRHACLIEKSAAPAPTPKPAVPPPLVKARPGDVPETISFTVHVGRLGDRLCANASFAAAAADQNIQGFTLHALSSLRADAACRARLRDESWTDWAGCDVYVGTRGQGADLQGFSVRLDGPSRRTYDLQVAGLFRGFDAPVLAGNGEPCVAPSGNAPLYGMQVILRRADER